MLEMAMPFDEQVVDNLGIDQAYRDAVEGIGSPEKWMRSVEEMTNNRQAEAVMLAQQQQAMMETANEQEQPTGMPPM